MKYVAIALVTLTPLVIYWADIQARFSPTMGDWAMQNARWVAKAHSKNCWCHLYTYPRSTAMVAKQVNNRTTIFLEFSDE